MRSHSAFLLLALVICLLLTLVPVVHDRGPAAGPPVTLSKSKSVSKINLNAGTQLESSASRVLLLHGSAQTSEGKLVANYGKLPLSFEVNEGQTDASVKFVSRGRGYSLFLTDTQAVLALKKRSPETPETVQPHGVRDPNLRSAESEQQSESKIVHMHLVGANPSPRVVGMDELAGKANYFIGNDPSKWRTSIPTYAKVKYERVYPGVDLVYYGNHGQLEYDFVVAPGADPSIIQLSFAEPEKLRINGQGELLFGADEGAVHLEKPVVYQTIGGKRKMVDGSFLLTTNNHIAFQLGPYEASQPLVIDPVLVYSTYLGGTANGYGTGIAVDASGNAYVTGYVDSTGLPTVNAFQPVFGGQKDAFVAKLNPTGSALVYSTYLGGSGPDMAWAIAIDASGNAYLTGQTTSNDFPIANALQPIYRPPLSGFPVPTVPTGFVTELNPSGSALVYSTYLGGTKSDFGQGIAVDGSGNAYVTGYAYSTDFPTVNPIQATNNTTYNFNTAFVSKISAGGSSLVYSTYLGGSGSQDCCGPTGGGDFGYGIAVDSSGNAYVTGGTWSSNFPTVNPIQAGIGGSENGFVTKINAAGSALVFSTYLGGSGQCRTGEYGPHVAVFCYGDWGQSIAVDASGNVYVTGVARSLNFPVANALQATNNAGANNYFGSSAFVTKLNPTGSAFVYSTYLGGTASPSPNVWGWGDTGQGIATDASGNAYITGLAGSVDFPTANALQPKSASTGGGNAFVAEINATGSALLFSTYLGGSGNSSPSGSSGDSGQGIAVDASGNAYVTGYTNSGNFPTLNALQAIATSLPNVFVTKIRISPGIPTTTVLTSSNNPANLGQSLTFTATVTPQVSGTPTGNVTFLDGSNQLGQVALGSNGQAQYTTSVLAAGSHSISAQYSGDATFLYSYNVAGIKQVVLPPPSLVSTNLTPSIYQIAPNGSLQLTLTGNYSDGSTQNLTNVATWASTNTAAATVNSSGLVSGIALGSTSVTASYGGVTSNVATIQVVTVPVNSYVQFLGGGTSSLFQELGLSAVNLNGGSGGACVWTQGASSSILARDNRTSPSTDEQGNIWVVWSPGTGTCAAPTGNVAIYSYMALDSAVANRCYFEVDSSGTPGCVQVLTISPNTAGANLLPVGDTTGGIPSTVISVLNGQHFFAAGTDLRPEDAKFAMMRAFVPCNQWMARQYFNQDSFYQFGLGYGAAGTNVGAPIQGLAANGGGQFSVVNFNITGNDPITTTQPVPAYQVTTVGAQPVIIAVSPTSDGYVQQMRDITGFALAELLQGNLARTNDLLYLPGSQPQTAAEPLNVLLQAPLSGVYNTLEYSIPNGTQFHGSQDANNCSSPGGPLTNPLDIATFPGTFGLGAPYRSRVIGPGNMAASLLAGRPGGPRLGYFFWSVGTAQGLTNVKYLTVNAVDPLYDQRQSTYQYTGILPGSGAPGDPGLSRVNFAMVNAGDYPIWSPLRLIAPPGNAVVAAMISQLQTLGSSQKDYIPASQLTAWHSHFGINGESIPAPSNGSAIGSQPLCAPAWTTALTEAGGDAGGSNILVQSNVNFCLDFNSGTGKINMTQ